MIKSKIGKIPMNKNFLIIAVIAVAILVFYGFSNSATIGTSSTDHTEAVLVSENANSAVYSYTWVASQASRISDCSESQTASISFDGGFQPSSMSAQPVLVDNLELNQEIKTTNVQFGSISLLLNSCSDKTTGGTLVVDDANAYCTISDGPNVGGTKRANVKCKFDARFSARDASGKVANGNFGTLTSATATFEVPKKGASLPVENLNTEAETTQEEQVIETTEAEAQVIDSQISEEVKQEGPKTYSGFIGNIVNFFSDIWNKIIGVFK